MMKIMRQHANSTSMNHRPGYGGRHLSLVVAMILSVFFGISGCRTEPTKAWNPILEETGFSHLETTAKKIQEAQQQALQDFADGRIEAGRDSLNRAAEATADLVAYAIPMTEVRQLVYDAGRFYVLGSPQQARAKLDLAASLMQQIGKADGPALLNETKEVYSLLQDLVLAMEGESPTVPVKFKFLGHRVNLMALKSDLVLSGAHFREANENQAGK